MTDSLVHARDVVADLVDIVADIVIDEGQLPAVDDHPVDLSLIGPLHDPYVMDAALLHLARIVAAAQWVTACLEEVFLADIRVNGAVRVGGTVYTRSPVRRVTVPDPAALAVFLGADWPAVIRVDGGNLRLTNLRTLATARGMDPRAAVDTFVVIDTTGAKLGTLPIGGKYTPAWANALVEGERRTTTQPTREATHDDTDDG